MAGRQDKLDQRLWEYLDGAMAGKELEALQRELKADPALRERLEKLSALRSTMAALPKAAAPAHFAERVLAQAERRGVLDDADQHHREPYWWVNKVVAAAAIVLVVALGGSIFHVLHRSSYMDRLASHESRPGASPGVRPVRDMPLAKKLAPAVAASKDAAADEKTAITDLAGLASGGDEFEQPVVIATSDLPETRRDVEHVLYANAFVSDHKIGMNNYVIEQSGLSQVIRVRGDSQQVQNVVSQLQSLQRASEQARSRQSQEVAGGVVLRSATGPSFASNATERPVPRVIVQQMMPSQAQERLNQAPAAAAAPAPRSPAPANSSVAGQPVGTPSSAAVAQSVAPNLTTAAPAAMRLGRVTKQDMADSLPASQPATELAASDRYAGATTRLYQMAATTSRAVARQLVILIQPEE